ncbi:helix-turn-helix domain-containing protein [Streptomyces sp. NPDC002643]
MAGGFAELLRELKERSGLSYGALAKRLHMSTSTLHRYCNGDAVPADYAPVERLARLCKATPDELVELHRRWVLADATRGRKEEAVAPGTAAVSGAVAASSGAVASEGGAVSERAAASEGAGVPEAAGALAEAGVPEDVVSRVVGVDGDSGVRSAPRRRTRVALVAGVAVAAVLGAVTLAMSLPSGGTADGRERTDGATSVKEGGAKGTGDTPAASPSEASPSASASEKDKKKEKEKGDGGKGAAASAGPTNSGAADEDDDTGNAAPPLTVKVEPYTWESPCDQRYLVDRAPAEVGPPPLETDSAAWVESAGAVSSGQQFVTLTVQGTGAETVVIRSLTVRMVDRQAPLAWNDYIMGYPGVGCGAGVPTRSFTVALDATRPAVQPAAGSKDFPYSVSESDPEVYYVKADASAYYVSWYLELKWSSGSRSGTLVLNDAGQPFRTSGNNGRPAYEYPLGGPKWVEEGTTVGDQG